jgi:alpha,alpha-trehalose phosphorylase
MARENPGLHVASLAGTWTAAVHGFAGLRDRGGELQFRLRVRREQLEVEIRPEHAEYRSLSGEGLEAWHEEERLHLAPGEAVGAAIGRTV